VHAKQQRPSTPQLQHKHQQSSSSRGIAVQAVATETTTATATTASPGWLKSLLPFGRKQDQPLIPTISRTELEALLQATTAPAESCSQVPLVVVFSATWCGPCKVMMQRMENISKQLGPQGVKVVKIDTGAVKKQVATPIDVCL
jgi:thiol-disulfide isomerase/thioredoxin